MFRHDHERPVDALSTGSLAISNDRDDQKVTILRLTTSHRREQARPLIRCCSSDRITSDREAIKQLSRICAATTTDTRVGLLSGVMRELLPLETFGASLLELEFEEHGINSGSRRRTISLDAPLLEVVATLKEGVLDEGSVLVPLSHIGDLGDEVHEPAPQRNDCCRELDVGVAECCSGQDATTATIDHWRDDRQQSEEHNHPQGVVPAQNPNNRWHPALHKSTGFRNTGNGEADRSEARKESGQRKKCFQSRGF